jgi:hypothetical protein
MNLTDPSYRRVRIQSAAAAPVAPRNSSLALRPTMRPEVVFVEIHARNVVSLLRQG